MILSFDEARERVLPKSILLDGAFDPLHVGHLAYIDKVQQTYPLHVHVVAVASDDDIRAKGREPLYDQATRAKILDAL